MYRALLRLRTILATSIPFIGKGRAITIIAKAGLFDSRWYLTQNPEVAQAGIDPLVHYVDCGTWEGRDPHPLFDTDWYLSNNPDVARAKVNPFAHYIARGAEEGRDPHPLFDTDWYLSRTPGVARAGVNPLAHYIASSPREGVTPHPLFDTAWYLSENPDVAAQQVNPLVHYLVQGAREGRDPHPLFDSDWYLSRNLDVATAGLNPLAHYVTQGALELRDPHPLFSATWYRAHNPQTSSVFVNPLIEYLSLAGEGKYPHVLFDTEWYLSQNPDVALAQVSPLLHYLLHGAAEARDPNPLFDTDWYLSEDPQVAAANINPLSHYVISGASHGAQPSWQFDVESYPVLHPDIATSGMTPLAHCLLGNAKAQKRRDAAFAAAQKAFPRMADIEPDLSLSIAHSSINNLKYATGHAKRLRFTAWRQLLTSIDRIYNRMIFVPSPDFAENDPLASNIWRAIQQLHGCDDTLVIATDNTNIPVRNALSAGIPLRNLLSSQIDLTVPDRIEVITALIYHMQPAAVLNLNSATLWRTIEERGPALARVTSLFTYVLDRTRAPDDRISGLTERHFRNCFRYLTRIYADNASLIELLIDTYEVPNDLRERFRAVYNPLRTALTTPRSESLSHPERASACCVLWRAGSAPDPAPSIISGLGRQYSSVMFDVYACDQLDSNGSFAKDVPANVRPKGRMSSVDDIQFDRYFAILYVTSQEGLPNLVVEAAGCGLPIVAPKIGGICELIDDETGWPVRKSSAAEYIQALRQIRENPIEVARRVANMLALVRNRHTWDRYLEALLQPPSFLES
jgi:Glycosyl transferases group 1